MAFPSRVYTSDTNHMSKRKKTTDLWKWKIRFQKDDAALDWCSDMSNLRKMTIAICHKQNEREKGVLIILFVSSCFGNNFSWIHQHDIHVHEMCLTFTEGFFPQPNDLRQQSLSIYICKGRIKTLSTILTRN